MTPQERSREWLKQSGWIFGTVEQNVRFPSKVRPGAWEIFKRDLFNFADLVAIHPEEFGTRYIQVTSSSNKTARIEKMREMPAIPVLLRAGNTVELHCWSKKGPRGVRKIWTLDRFQARIATGEIHWEKQNQSEIEDDLSEQLTLAVQGEIA